MSLSKSKIETPHDNCGFCEECGCALGFYNKTLKSGKERKLFYFSNKQHPKLGLRRIRCIDCFQITFGRAPKAPNVVNDDFIWLLGADPDELQLLKNEKAITKKKLIDKYGEEEGLVRWDNYRRKQAHTASSEYFMEEKGLTEDEVKEFHRSRACTLENLKRRHGEEEGEKRWKKYLERQSYTCSEDYFIENYGSGAGKQKFENFERGKRQTIKDKMEHHGVCFLEASILINQYWRGKEKEKKPSEVAQSFFRIILRDYYPKTDGVYNDLISKEFGVPSEDGSHYFFYDFVDIKNKLCIEFHGDDWHGNPKKYSDEDFLFLRSKTAGEVWEYDKSRVKLMEKIGFTVFEIWESDYKNNLIEVLCDVEEFLNGNN